MSEKEKDLIVRISKAIPKLDKEKQSYVLGVAEGMILANEQACPKIMRKEKCSENFKRNAQHVKEY